MRSIPAVAGLLALALGLAACGSAASPGSSATPTAVATEAPTPTDGATARPTPTPREVPTETPGYGICDLPFVGYGGAPGPVQLTDVQVSTADDYDRITFAFSGGVGLLPDLEIDAAAPPFVEDPSGLPLPVNGTVFLRIIMRGLSGVAPDGTVTYDGPTTFDADFPALRQLVRAGDFEAVNTWIAGLNGAACLRLVTPGDGNGLLIDLQHPSP